MFSTPGSCSSFGFSPAESSVEFPQTFGGKAIWMASFGGWIVSAPHVSYASKILGREIIRYMERYLWFFLFGICIDELERISYAISYDLLSLLRDLSSRWSNPTCSPEPLHLIASDSVQGLGRDGLQLPPIDVPVWSLVSLASSQLRHFHIRNVQQKCLERGYTSSSFICRYFPSTTTYYKVRNLEGHLREGSGHGQRDGKWSSVQNVVATLKKR